MPNGKTHALATTITGGLISPLLITVLHQPMVHAVAFAGGCLAGLIINPDLDVQTGNRGFRVVHKTGGPLIGQIWRLFWYPYARWLIPRHRHPLSHLPILGTLIRLAYLFLVPAFLWWVLGHFISLPNLPRLSITLELQWAAAGLMIVDTIHTLMDWTWPK